MSLETVYDGTALRAAVSNLPGVALYQLIDQGYGPMAERELVKRKLEQSCRKLCLMWHASDCALRAEHEFWSNTIREAPALFGAEAVEVHYHLEAFVLFARSALDVSARAFGLLLPSPFPRDRFDSFNDLTKSIEASGPSNLRIEVASLRERPESWLSVLCGSQRGRALRDKISHQTDFPLFYSELHSGSEREYAMVGIDGVQPIQLQEFVEKLRTGVVQGFLAFEEACISAFR